MPSGDDLHWCVQCAVAVPLLTLVKRPGYVFRSAPAILSFLEQPKIGPTSQFCSDLARRLECYVAAGYPERLRDNERNAAPDTPVADITEVGANSAMVYGPDGECVSE
jgi:protein N-terminal amidase